MAEKNYSDVLIEDMNSKFDAIMEAVSAMQDNVKKIPKMAERLEKLESDMSIVKLTTRVTSDDTKLIKIRTEKLENIQEELLDLQKRVKALESTA
jgi:phage-related tail protein